VSIFGPEPVTLHECFITWAQKQKKPQQITAKVLLAIALKRAASGIKDHFMDTSGYEPYATWRTKWDALSKPEQQQRTDLHQEMNRLAFTKHDLMDVFFSFCRSEGGEWEHEDHTWHCRVCGECNDWRACPPPGSEDFRPSFVNKWLA